MTNMTNKKIIIIVLLAVLLLLLIGGSTYAWFVYNGESNINNTLIAGDIRMNVLEGNDTLTLSNVFPETKEEARERENNTLTFTVSGTNESSKAILYSILLNEGASKSNKSRFSPDEIVFDLSEINGNNEILLIDAQKFSSFSDTVIYDNLIAGNTASVSHTYKLRAWIDENVIISETESGDHVYSTYDYPNKYATVKVTVKGLTVSEDVYTVTFDGNGRTVMTSNKAGVTGQV